MGENSSAQEERIRAAEVVAAMCLATDLGMGFPFEPGLHATLITMRLADLLGVDSQTASQTYYVSLLVYSGCTTDAHVSTKIFKSGLTANVTPVQFGSPTEAIPKLMRAVTSPDSPPLRRVYEIASGMPKAARYRKPHFRAICEVATMFTERLGLPQGDDIPLPLRIVHVARDAAFQRLIGGDEHAAKVIRERAGHAFDPEIANRFADAAFEILRAADVPESAWDATLDLEPRPWLSLEGGQIDGALAAMGDFADLPSPSLSGHSSGVAQLASAAAEVSGFDPAVVTKIRMAWHLHHLGRAAVHPGIWEKTGALSADEWEQVRLHPYHTARLLDRSRFLESLARIACSHHERLDGTGYHRGETTMTLSPYSRILAAADAFHAMTEPRAHRPALSRESAAEVLNEEAREGRLDAQMVAAVPEASGMPPQPVERPARLTERESEVISLLARGLQTKQVARALDISIKTADRHIQNAYRKTGVSTRAAATLFAMEHGLVQWGELPISR